MSELALLEIRNLSRSFGGLPAVANASFTVQTGTITALIGPNGAGKTTLFNIVSGSSRADRGEIYFGGRRASGLPPYRLVAMGLVRTFQLTRVFRRMTVLDNMLVAGQENIGERLTGLPFARSTKHAEARLRKRATELLARVKLDRKQDMLAGELSGGQQRLLEFVRAMMPQPRLLLLDEPLAGVNPALAQELLVQMRELRTDHGITFLFIEHDLPSVMAISDCVVVMDAGQVVAQGSPESVRSNPRVIEAYIGGPLH